VHHSIEQHLCGWRERTLKNGSVSRINAESTLDAGVADVVLKELGGKTG
jgi:hypothetical protein